MSTAALSGGPLPGAKGPWGRLRTGTVGGLVRAISSNRKATAGLVILVVFCFLAAFPGVVAHDNPQAEIFAPALGPSFAHLLGTDAYGQDLFAQLIYSTRVASHRSGRRAAGHGAVGDRGSDGRLLGWAR